MDPTRPLAQTTIQEILDAYPQASSVFIRHRMACIGCALAPFCTLASAAQVYNVSLLSLITECQEAIMLPPDNIT